MFSRAASLARWITGLSCLAALTACTHMQTTPTTAAGVAPVTLTQVQRWDSAHLYAELKYPVILGAAAPRLNPVIQAWIGARCPVPQAEHPTYASPGACAAAFMNACRSLKQKFQRRQPNFGCTLDATSAIRVDAAGLLGVTYTTYAYTGGAHGNTVVSQLNLNIDSARILGLDDLLIHPDATRLTRKIEIAMRHKRHIPADQSLRQAGFLVDKLPMTHTVLALPQGLLFTYQSYVVAPYVYGQPSALVPYTALQDLVNPNGPLPRLMALGHAAGLHN